MIHNTILGLCIYVECIYMYVYPYWALAFFLFSSPASCNSTGAERQFVCAGRLDSFWLSFSLSLSFCVRSSRRLFHSPQKITYSHRLRFESRRNSIRQGTNANNGGRIWWMTHVTLRSTISLRLLCLTFGGNACCLLSPCCISCGWFTASLMTHEKTSWFDDMRLALFSMIAICCLSPKTSRCCRRFRTWRHRLRCKHRSTRPEFVIRARDGQRIIEIAHFNFSARHASANENWHGAL